MRGEVKPEQRTGSGGVCNSSKHVSDGGCRISVPPWCDERVARADLHRPADGSRHRALVGVEPVHTLDRVPVGVVGLEFVGDVHPTQHEHPIVNLDLASDLSTEATASRRDAARF